MSATSPTLSAIAAAIDRLDGRFDGLENRFDVLENRFNVVERRFDTLEARMNSLEDSFNTFKISTERSIDGLGQSIIDLGTMMQSELDKKANKVDLYALGRNLRGEIRQLHSLPRG